MNVLAGYFWRVICAAVICALLGNIGGKGTGYGLRKLMSGMFLALTLLSPLGDMDLPEFDTTRIRAEAQDAIRTGTEQAARARNAIIIDAIEAYIWNEADQLGLELEVCVTLDEQGRPETIELAGAVPPPARRTLAACITRDLGLGEEDQIWITPHQSSE